MNFAIIGYGKMGKEIEKIALQRNHTVSLIIDINTKGKLTSKNLENIDVAIEFTNSTSAIENYKLCFKNNTPVVSGTTGIQSEILDKIKLDAKTNNNSFFWASNFSIGVNIFFEINKKLASIMNNFKEYEVQINEIHHTQKLDSPSGTAITLATDIIKNIEPKNNWTKLNPKTEEILISSQRIGETTGTHTVKYFCDTDNISITHQANNRNGFALGAVLAAEFLHKKTGIYNMNDLLNINS